MMPKMTTTTAYGVIALGALAAVWALRRGFADALVETT